MSVIEIIPSWYLTEKLSELPLDKSLPFEDFFKAAPGLLGLELHRAMLTVVVTASEEDDNRALLADSYCREGGRRGHVTHIDLLDVHPTEPWVLINGWENTIYIWNWQTNERIGEYQMRISYPDGNDVAQFIARKHWVVTGKTDGSILVLMSPKMDPVKEFHAHHEGVTSLAIHRTRPLLLSSSSLSVRLWDWDRGWSCTGMFEVTTPVRQVMFNHKHTTTFASFHKDGKVMVCLYA